MNMNMTPPMSHGPRAAPPTKGPFVAHAPPPHQHNGGPYYAAGNYGHLAHQQQQQPPQLPHHHAHPAAMPPQYQPPASTFGGYPPSQGPFVVGSNGLPMPASHPQHHQQQLPTPIPQQNFSNGRQNNNPRNPRLSALPTAAKPSATASLSNDNKLNTSGNGSDHNGVSATSASATTANAVSDDPVVIAYRATTEADRAYYTLDSILGHVVPFASDAEGSRGLQRMISEASGLLTTLTRKGTVDMPTVKPPRVTIAPHSLDRLRAVFAEIQPKLREVIFSTYGNFVVQKFIETQCCEFIVAVANFCKGKAVSMAKDDFGCRILQNLVETQLMDGVSDIVAPHVIALVKELSVPSDEEVYAMVVNQNANHVLQRCMTFFPQETAFVAKIVLPRFTELAKHVYGSRVIQCIFEQMKAPHVAPEDEIRSLQMMYLSLLHFPALVNTQYGNFAVTHALVNSPSEDADMSHIMSRVTIKRDVVAPQDTTTTTTTTTTATITVATADDGNSDLTATPPTAPSEISGANVSTTEINTAAVALPTVLPIVVLGTTTNNTSDNAPLSNNSNTAATPTTTAASAVVEFPFEPNFIRRRIIETILPDLIGLASSKFASNVAQRVFQFANDEQQRRIMAVLMQPQSRAGTPNIVALMMDQYANYVMQDILVHCSDQQRAELMKVVRPYLSQVSRSQFGRHIVSKTLGGAASHSGARGGSQQHGVPRSAAMATHHHAITGLPPPMSHANANYYEYQQQGYASPHFQHHHNGQQGYPAAAHHQPQGIPPQQQYHAAAAVPQGHSPYYAPQHAQQPPPQHNVSQYYPPQQQLPPFLAGLSEQPQHAPHYGNTTGYPPQPQQYGAAAPPHNPNGMSYATTHPYPPAMPHQQLYNPIMPHANSGANYAAPNGAPSNAAPFPGFVGAPHRNPQSATSQLPPYMAMGGGHGAAAAPPVEVQGLLDSLLATMDGQPLPYQQTHPAGSIGSSSNHSSPSTTAVVPSGQW